MSASIDGKELFKLSSQLMVSLDRLFPPPHCLQNIVRRCTRAVLRFTPRLKISIHLQVNLTP